MTVPSAEAMPHITIDARWMSSGAGTYAFNVLKRVKACDPSLHIHALTCSADRERVTPYCDRLSVVDARLYSLQEQFEFALIGRRFPLHSTHYNAPLLHRGPLLVTIPDVIPLLASGYCASWKSRFYARPVLRAIAARADHILTVSEHSRDQLMRHVSVRPENITVAYNGVGPEFHPMDRSDARKQVLDELGIDGPFLLYVGNFRPHKNVDGLLRAFHLFRTRQDRDCRLLLIGNDITLLSRLRSQASALGLSKHTVFRQDVPQSLLVACYGAAQALVLPSFEEGFGLPVLEAMACGTPVACSHTPSLQEVGGDAVAYFDPYNNEHMAEVMAQVASDNALRNQLRERGIVRAAKFTWEQSAQTHVEVYRRFLN